MVVAQCEARNVSIMTENVGDPRTVAHVSDALELATPSTREAATTARVREHCARRSSWGHTARCGAQVPYFLAAGYSPAKGCRDNSSVHSLFVFLLQISRP